MLKCSSSSSTLLLPLSCPYCMCGALGCALGSTCCVFAPHGPWAAGFCKVTVCARLFALSLATVLGEMCQAVRHHAKGW